MKSPDINTLRILEEIDGEENPSQRDIARKIDVSLGLVNSFIKRLARKGFFKIVNIPGNRVKYILTPKGAAEKTRLTYQYIQYSYYFYKDARIKLKKLFAVLAEQNVKSVAFYGATDLAEIAYLSLQETSIELIAVFDEVNAGCFFLNSKIEHPDRLPEFSYDRILYTNDEPNDDFFKKINKEKLVLIR